jgi:hypothetical protein
MRFACWLTKATDTQSEYIIRIAFPLQQWLRERASMLRYIHNILPVFFVILFSHSYARRMNVRIITVQVEIIMKFKVLLEIFTDLSEDLSASIFRARESFLDSITPMIDIPCLFGMLVTISQSTCCKIPEGLKLHHHPVRISKLEWK